MTSKTGWNLTVVQREKTGARYQTAERLIGVFATREDALAAHATILKSHPLVYPELVTGDRYGSIEGRTLRAIAQLDRQNAWPTLPAPFTYNVLHASVALNTPSDFNSIAEKGA